MGIWVDKDLDQFSYHDLTEWRELVTMMAMESTALDQIATSVLVTNMEESSFSYLQTSSS